LEVTGRQATVPSETNDPAPDSVERGTAVPRTVPGPSCPWVNIGAGVFGSGAVGRGAGSGADGLLPDGAEAGAGAVERAGAALWCTTCALLANRPAGLTGSRLTGSVGVVETGVVTAGVAVGMVVGAAVVEPVVGALTVVPPAELPPPSSGGSTEATGGLATGLVTVPTTGAVTWSTTDATEVTVCTVPVRVLFRSDIRPLTRPDNGSAEEVTLVGAVLLVVVPAADGSTIEVCAAEATAEPSSQAAPAKPAVIASRRA
jgi:hypothetical protein